MKNFFTSRALLCLTALLMAWSLRISAAPFTPGNIVVVRLGTGTATLSAAAQATFLDEYTPAGVLVQSVALPTAAAGTNRALTETGTSTSDAGLTRSADGRYLVLTGYDAAPGTAALAQTTATAVNRIIGRVAANGTVDTSTRIDDTFFSTATPPANANIRSAATATGANFYAVGSTGGVRYVPLGNAGPSTALNTTAPTNNRVVNIFDGNLYLSSASGAFQGISQVGTGLPTTAPQTIVQLPGFPVATGPSPYGFFFADLSATVAGVDVVYVADDRPAPDGGIQKWSLVGGTWTLNGTVNNGAASLGLRGVNGSVNSTTVALVASGNAGLFAFSDNAGYNAAPSTTTLPAAIATPATNTAFRGVAFAPVSGTATPAPTIASFTPTTGAAGATVTITGTNLTGATALTLNGVAIMGYTVVNATTLTFTLPSGATSGTLAVTTAGGTATSTGSFTVAAPAPTITNFTPASGPVGTVVTVNGTNLTGATSASVNGVAGTNFMVMSATQIMFTVAAGSSTGPVRVTTAGGTAVSATSFTVTVLAPTITGFAPMSGPVGTTVTVIGTNFAAGATVRFNGTAAATVTVLSATQLTALVPAGASTGPITVTVGANTATSATNFTVTVATPAPTITGFTPTTGAAGMTVTLTGTNLTGATALTLNGLTITGYTVVNATTITFAVPAGATTGTLAVTTAGGTATSTGSFTVIGPNPVPVITSLTPSSVVAGAGGFTVVVTGTGFLPTSVVNSTAPVGPTTYLSATQLSVVLPPGAGPAGTYPFTVVNPTPGGGTSNAVNLTVTDSPLLTSITPATAVAGGAGFTLTATGQNFTASSVITFNGVDLPTTLVSATTLTAAVPAAAIATAGALPVTITTSTPGGTASAPLTFTVTTPAPAAPTIASFTPTTGASGTVVTLTGTNLTGATGLTLNGVAITGYTVVNATTITFTVPATATSGPIAVTTAGGTATSTGSFAVTPVAGPVPTITGISPARAVVGGPAFTLTVSGTNLSLTTTVDFRGVSYPALTATGNSTAGSITVLIPASAIATVGTFPIIAANGSSVSSGPTTFSVVAAPTVLAFEDFEQGTSTSYTNATPVALRSGAWTFTNALLGDLFNDRVNQARAARVRGGGSIAMSFDKPNGAGTVTISAATFGTDTGASFTVEISTNGGMNYSPLAGAPATLTNALVPYTFTVNRAGNVRLRFTSTNTSVGQNPRINLDDLFITNYTLATNPGQALPGLSVYPNPTQGRLTVALPQPGAAQVAVLDLLGRVLLPLAPLPATGEVLLPATLAAGTYLLEVRQGTAVAVRRVTKE